MKPQYIQAGLITILFSCLIYSVYLASDANLRAEHYRLMYEDAASIVEKQSHSINDASRSLASASGILETCIMQMRFGQ